MQWFYLWLAFLSLFAFGLADNARGPVFPDLLREFGVNDSAGALFFFTTSLFSLGNNFLSQYWLPRWGAYLSVRIYLAAQAAGLVVMGLAPSYAGVLAGSALFGVGMGGLGVAQNTLVGRASSGQSRRRAFSFLHCMYGAASLVAPMIVSLVYEAGFHWQRVLLWMALPSFACWCATWLRVAPESDRGQPGGRALVVQRRGVALAIAIASGLYVMTEILLSTRIVLLARRVYGLDAVGANDRLTIFFALLFAGRAIFVFAPPKWPPMAVMKASAWLSLFTFALGLCLGPGWLAFTGLAMAPFFPAAMAHVQEKFGSAADGAMSWTFTCSSLLTMVMHQGVGLAGDALGLWHAMWLGPMALFASILALRSVEREDPAFSVTSS